jgi:hypothetical protein
LRAVDDYGSRFHASRIPNPASRPATAIHARFR